MGRWTKRTKKKRAIKEVNRRLAEMADAQQRELEARAMKYIHRFGAVLSAGLGIFGTLASGSTAGKVAVAVTSTLIGLVSNLDKVLGRDNSFQGQDRRDGN
jgi:hypothetical protein